MKSSKMYQSFLLRAYGPFLPILPFLPLALWQEPPSWESTMTYVRWLLFLLYLGAWVTSNALTTRFAEGGLFNFVATMTTIFSRLGTAMIVLHDQLLAKRDDTADAKVEGSEIVLSVLVSGFLPVVAIIVFLCLARAACQTIVGGTFFLTAAHVVFQTALIAVRGAPGIFERNVFPVIRIEATKDQEEAAKVGQEKESRNTAREQVMLCYADYMTLIQENVFPMSALMDYLRDFMGDERAVEQVKRSGLDMRQKLGDIYAAEKAKKDSMKEEIERKRADINKFKGRIEAHLREIERLSTQPNIDTDDLEESIDEEKRKIRRLEKDIQEIEAS